MCRPCKLPDIAALASGSKRVVKVVIPVWSLVGTAFAAFSTFGWLAWTDQASGVLSRPGLHGGE